MGYNFQGYGTITFENAAKKAHAARAARGEMARAEAGMRGDGHDPAETKLDELLREAGWEVEDEQNGSFTLCCNDRLNETVQEVLTAIAPFVAEGCFIDCRGEDDSLWRWYFDGNKLVEMQGTVVYK